MGQRRHSVLKEVLKALVPYSRNNLMLAYHPNKFFNELERTTGATEATVRSTFSRAKRNNLINTSGSHPVLTWKGKVRAGFQPEKKTAGHWILVIFDIPENQRSKRYLLREFLKMEGFEQIQKSVWGSQYEPSESLVSVIDELRLNQYVSIFSADRLRQ